MALMRANHLSTVWLVCSKHLTFMIHAHTECTYVTYLSSPHPFQKLVELLRRMFDKYVTKVLDFSRKNCRELVPTSHLNAVTSLCYLLDALVTAENGVSRGALCGIAHNIKNHVFFRCSLPSSLSLFLSLPPLSLSLFPNLPVSSFSLSPLSLPLSH